MPERYKKEVTIPKALKKRMDQFKSHVQWRKVAERAFQETLEKLETVEGILGSKRTLSRNEFNRLKRMIQELEAVGYWFDWSSIGWSVQFAA